MKNSEPNNQGRKTAGPDPDNYYGFCTAKACGYRESSVVPLFDTKSGIQRSKAEKEQVFNPRR